MRTSVRSDLNPLLTEIEISKIHADSVGLAIKNIINTKRISLREAELLCEVNKSSRSLFSKKEIGLIIEYWPEIIQISESHTGMLAFKAFSDTLDWNVSEISKINNISRKSIYQWIKKFQDLGLLIRSPNKALGNIEFYRLNWEEYRYIIIILREFFNGILLQSFAKSRR